MNYKEVHGDLIKMAQEGHFDVIAHGCNCFCTMGAGIAPQMAKAFGADRFPMEANQYRGDINKLGTIDWQARVLPTVSSIAIVNAYTQYDFGSRQDNLRPLDYNALILCMKKINHIFKGKRIGLPKIGCGLAGGNWEAVKIVIQRELKDCDVTIVMYNPGS